MPGEAVIRLTDVWVRYDREPVLEDINLTINAHDFMGIIGPNGGGKSTLLKVMLGLINPARARSTSWASSRNEADGMWAMFRSTALSLLISL